MAMILTRFKVSDYAQFRAAFGGNDDLRHEAGISNSRVYRNADDGQDVMVLSDVSDAARARESMQRSEYQSAMRDDGLAAPPVLHIIE